MSAEHNHQAARLQKHPRRPSPAPRNRESSITTQDGYLDPSPGFGILLENVLTLLQSAISLYLYERRGKKTLSRLFDKVSLMVFFAGYLVINLVLPLAATL